MDVIVYVRQSASSTSYKITEEGKISAKGMTYELNEWDKYAIEEALLIREKFGGSVTALAIGPERTDRVLRECLALGADRAIRFWDDEMPDADCHITANVLNKIMRQMNYDLILSGSQDDEDTSAHVIPAVAHELGIQHATIVTKIQIEDHKAKVQRELENDVEEILEIDLPAIFCVQSGINVPRYASMSGMMKAKKKELKFMGIESIGITKTDISDSAAKTILEEIYVPEVEQTAEILSGTIDEMTNKLLSVLIDKEVL